MGKKLTLSQLSEPGVRKAKLTPGYIKRVWYGTLLHLHGGLGRGSFGHQTSRKRWKMKRIFRVLENKPTKKERTVVDCLRLTKTQ